MSVLEIIVHLDSPKEQIDRKFCSMDYYTNIIVEAFNTTLEGILLTDQNYNIVLTNNAIGRHLGYAPEELIGKNLKLILPDYDNIIYPRFNQAKESSLIQNTFEVNGIHKKGHSLPIEIRLSHFNHQDNIYTKNLITDVSSRKESEKKDHH